MSTITDYPAHTTPIEHLLGRMGYQMRPEETPEDRKIKNIFSQIDLINGQNIPLEEKVRQARKLKLPKSFHDVTQTFYFTVYPLNGNIGYTPDKARSSFLSWCKW